MKKKRLLLITAAACLIYFSGCEFGEQDDAVNPPSTTDKVVVSGQIVESISGNPVFNASVKITDGTEQVNAISDANGKFTAEIFIAQDKELTLIAFKEGYSTDSLKFYASAGKPVTVPIIQIRQMQGTGETSSKGAATVNLYSQSHQSVGVIESGASESVQLIFQVLDSTGVAIGSANAVTVNFILSAGPGGGEYLYPSSVVTNALGRAAVSLNTGTKAGVVQVTAEVTTNGRTFRSSPVSMAIYGGFPDETHFAVATNSLNFPLYGIIGGQINFTAYAGDKYSNPVRPGTTVYFSANSGIIGGSDQTDDLGRATVTLLTQPFPDDEVYGPGFFSVTASTVNETQTSIFTHTLRLLSGETQISNVTPSTFNLANGGSQNFTFTVSDQNGNPLAAGTNISVKVDEGDLKVSGDIDVRLPDTYSKAYTTFSFTAFDSKPEEEKVNSGVITISVTSPNGEKKFSISGTGR